MISTQELYKYKQITMELFDVSRRSIPSIYSLEKTGILEEDYWGKGCGFRSIQEPEIAKNILKNLPSTEFTRRLNTEGADIRYITYNIKDSYTIDYHNDSCDATLIVYIYKDGNLLLQNLWNYLKDA